MLLVSFLVQVGDVHHGAGHGRVPGIDYNPVCFSGIPQQIRIEFDVQSHGVVFGNLPSVACL